MAKQKIRIRLKAYEHRILDQSADKIVEREQVLKFPVLFRCQRNAHYIRLSVHHTSTKILVNNSKCAHTSV